jgi:hypothetical protein
VAGPLQTDLRSFDLTTEARNYRRNLLVFLGILAGMGVLFAAVATGLALAPGAQLDSYFRWGAVAAFYGFGGFFLYYALRRRIAPVCKLTLDQESLDLTFTDGSSQSLRWEDPAFAVTLRDYSTNPRYSEAQRKLVTMLLPPYRASSISHEVASAITDVARARGLNVMVRGEWIAGAKGGARHVATRIGQLALTPGWKDARPIPE